jgi:hypothetical protein
MIRPGKAPDWQKTGRARLFVPDVPLASLIASLYTLLNRRNEGQMAERWLGFKVSGDKVVMVDAEMPGVGPIILVADHTWSLQKGSREDAYHVIYQQVSNYLREHEIKRVVISFSRFGASSMGSQRSTSLQSGTRQTRPLSAGMSRCRSVFAQSLTSRSLPTIWRGS